jgi:hypothetical protein
MLKLKINYFFEKNHFTLRYTHMKNADNTGIYTRVIFVLPNYFDNV